MEILLAAPPGWPTDALCGLLEKLAPAVNVHVVPDATSLETPGASPDLILLDIDSAASNAPGIVASAARSYRFSRIVAMGSLVDSRFVESLLAAGALAYLPRSFSEAVVLGTLKMIVGHDPSGQSGASPSYKDSEMRLPEPAQTGDSERWLEFGLTGRQTDVLALVCEGKTNQAIATRLGIDVGTVKQHMTKILQKLKLRNRSEAVLFASRFKSVNFRQIKKAEGGKLDLDWLLGHMTHQRLLRDTVLFRAGDAADELYYLQRGTIRLEEIAADLQSGTMFGEIGIFSPSHKRTCSAVCTSNADVFKLTSDQVKRLYLLNPQFALYIVHLISQRLMADRNRSV